MERDRAATAVAIIGMAGRFPGAPDVGSFWDNVRRGVESITFFTDDELVALGVPAELARDPSYVPARGIVEDADCFDGAFFGMSAREAETTDPQQRLFLECAYAALEDAGYDPRRYPGLIGVFAGCGSPPAPCPSDPGDPVAGYQWTIGNRGDFLATRVSYKLDLRGPSLAVQTACSTSLVNVCVACQNLVSAQCDLALAGGVSLGDRAGYIFRDGMILSPDGHCRAFDAAAQGTVPGEGVGVVVLKRLGDALAEGDTIRAVIRGCGLNNDGGDKIGYTAPRVQGQADAISRALATAGVDADAVAYVEAHGTATPLGDAVEIAALTKAYRQKTARTGFCAIGSVKTNIGHLDAAAGVAGLIKTVLALEHGEIPPSLHFRTPNPHLDLASSPFFVPTELGPWPAERTRVAGVSSFGIGGTNAHLIVEAPPPVPPPPASCRPELLVVSAATPSALHRARVNLAAYLRRPDAAPLADVAFTLQHGRRELKYRHAVVAGLPDEAAEILAGTAADPPAVAGRPDVAFVFPGQAGRYGDKARELYTVEPAFRSAVDRAAELVHSIAGPDLTPLTRSLSTAGDPGSEVDWERTEFAQPALFVLEYAIAEWLGQRGVRPDALLGHSLGEYAAAHLAGVFSLEDAVRLVVTRGRLMQSTAPGAMLAVRLPESELLALLPSALDLAAVNGVSECVVSGSPADVERFERRLVERGGAAHRLPASVGFHSRLMDPVLDGFAACLAGVELRAPERPWVSSVTGTWVSPEEATDPGYWLGQIRRPVRFAAALDCLFSSGRHVVVEVGPGDTLSGLARRHPSRAADQVLLPTLGRDDGTPASRRLLATLGRLWVEGAPVEWEEGQATGRRRVPLPTYPFERTRYGRSLRPAATPTAPAPSKTASPTAIAATTKHPDPGGWFYAPVWEDAGAQPSPVPAPRRWVVLVDGDSVDHGLTGRLGPDTVTVRPGPEFARLGEATYQVQPDRRVDFEALFSELERLGRLPDAVAHLWCVRTATAADKLADLDDRLRRSFSSVISIAQAWGTRHDERPLRLVVTTEEAQSVGRAARNPEQATVLGPCKVIPEEYPNISCTNVDVPLSGNDRDWPDRLVAELQSEANETVVALRGDQRFVLRYQRSPLEKAPDPHPRLRPGGVYLVTGGLGGLGLVFARHLAEVAGARLVLTGRHAERNGAVAELERAGATVLVAAADVADFDRMAAVVADARRRFGPFHGVIHAAGLTSGGVVQRMALDHALRILEPKVRGTLVLEKLFEGEPLDFFVLCSSLTAVLGGFGQADYCAANCYLDAYAQQQTRLGRPVISINWDGWQQVGAAARAARESRNRRSVTHPLLRPARPGSGERVVRLSADHWVVGEHRLDGTPTLPGTAYLDLVCVSALDRGWSFPLRVRELLLLDPLVVRDGDAVEAGISTEETGAGLAVTVSTGQGERRRPHMTARLIRGDDAPPASGLLDLSILEAEYPELLGGAARRGFGVEVGPRWQCLRWARRSEGGIVGCLELEDEFVSADRGFMLHPALLDVATGLSDQDELPYLPFSYCDVVIHEPLPARLYSRVRVRGGGSGDSRSRRAEVVLAADDGRIVLSIGDYVLRRRGAHDARV